MRFDLPGSPVRQLALRRLGGGVSDRPWGAGAARCRWL